MGKIFTPTAENWPATADAVVIGGGIVGVATAFWLSRAGLDTVLLEMRSDLSSLTSAQSIESFRAQFTEPAMSELAQESIRIHENFAEIIGIPDYDIALRHTGYLFVTDDPGKVDSLKAAVAKHHTLGVTDSEFLNAAEIHARFPYISERAVAATFRQRDGQFSSHAVTQGFAKGSTARFLLNTRVTGIRQDAQGVAAVETPHGAIATRLVVNAAGPFAGVVGRMVGLDLPLQPMRRQKVYIAPKPQIPQDAPLVIDIGSDAYWRPETGGAFIAWVDPDDRVREPSEHLPTDWDFPATVLDKLIPLTPFWETVCDTLKRSDVMLSAGQYVYTPDDQPLIGPLPDVPGFYLNCGYWAGVMLGAAAGRRVADLATGVLAPQQNALRPTRYAEGITTTGDSFLRGHH
ncbi:MAG: FAD-binding oxidoreductase [Chloroflexi bacterium]|nr:FAD-binding oxidoreductase [Chloroflexota bacterium]